MGDHHDFSAPAAGLELHDRLDRDNPQHRSSARSAITRLIAGLQPQIVLRWRVAAGRCGAALVDHAHRHEYLRLQDQAIRRGGSADRAAASVLEDVSIQSIVAARGGGGAWGPTRGDPNPHFWGKGGFFFCPPPPPPESPFPDCLAAFAPFRCYAAWPRACARSEPSFRRQAALRVQSWHPCRRRLFMRNVKPVFGAEPWPKFIPFLLLPILRFSASVP